MGSGELKKLRQHLGMSQEEMARALNVSFATVNRWENQRREMPPDTGRLLECLADLIDRASTKESRLSVAEVREAVQATGVLGVVSTAALAGKLARHAVLSLAAIPSFSWIAGAVGIGVLGALPFFAKLGKQRGPRTRADHNLPEEL